MYAQSRSSIYCSSEFSVAAEEPYSSVQSSVSAQKLITRSAFSMAQMSRSGSRSSDSGGSPGGSPGRSSTSSHPRTYMCKVCGNFFTSGQSLGGHMNVHRKESNNNQRSYTPPATAEYDQSPGTDNPSYKGVRYRKEQNKWVAEIRPPRATRTWWLGTYSTPEEAAYAYDVAIKYFGSESSLNFEGNQIYEQIPQISTDLQRQEFASELRKVVKKYGKMAMESGASASTSDSVPEVILGWEDFPPLENCPAEYTPFDFEDFQQPAPESSYQLPQFDQTNSSYYGHGYHNWPPYHDPKNY